MGIRCTSGSYWENRNSILFNYFVPAAKIVGADSLEFSVLEVPHVVNGRTKFKTAAKSPGKQAVRKHVRYGSRKRTARRVFLAKTAKKPVGREEIFVQTFLTNHFKPFSGPTFCNNFLKSRGKVPVVPGARNVSYYLPR